MATAPDNMIETLMELTGHESGAIVYEDGETMAILNWSQENGIPRQFATGWIGLGEDLSDAQPVPVPEWVVEHMQQHELENGADEVSDPGEFTAWEVAGVTVVVCNEWA